MPYHLKLHEIFLIAAFLGLLLVIMAVSLAGDLLGKAVRRVVGV